MRLRHPPTGGPTFSSLLAGHSHLRICDDALQVTIVIRDAWPMARALAVSARAARPVQGRRPRPGQRGDVGLFRAAAVVVLGRNLPCRNVF